MILNNLLHIPHILLRTKRQKRLVKFLLCLALSTFAVIDSQAEMYKWMDKNGQVHYTDKPPENHTTLEIKGTVSSYTAPNISDLPDDFFSTPQKRFKRKKVIMYSAQWCGVCKTAKRYFTQNKIPHTEYDIDQSEKARAEFDRLGGRGVPIILVGRKRMNGFSVERFNSLYKN